MAVNFGKASLAAAFLSFVHGARHRRAASRSFAGVPVLNYRANVQEWMILFHDGTTDDVMQSFCKGKCHMMGYPSKGGIPFVAIHGSEHEVEELVSQSPDLMEFVEPDEVDHMIPEIEVEKAYEKRAASTASWGLERTGVPTRPGTGRGVHVYVQDGGIRATHEDFGARVVPKLDLTSGSVLHCPYTGDPTCGADRKGHGTHCAGTIGGKKYGVASEAWLYAVKTLTDAGSGARSWQVTAIDWVTANGMKPSVISMSIGGPGQEPLYAKAIDAATAAGITVVAAAGNSNSDTCRFSPAFAPNAITVGATDRGNKRAFYSNFGKCNNIMAPGSAIISASHKSDGGVAELTGTSMAAPHVSGAAAILIETGVTTRDDILSSMKANGRVDYITYLNQDDPNLFLWVGSDPPPAEAPTEAPLLCNRRIAANVVPDDDGDCLCKNRWVCSRDTKVANCPSSGGIGAFGGVYFSPSCTDCWCYDQLNP